MNMTTFINVLKRIRFGKIFFHVFFCNMFVVLSFKTFAKFFHWKIVKRNLQYCSCILRKRRAAAGVRRRVAVSRTKRTR